MLRSALSIIENQRRLYLELCLHEHNLTGAVLKEGGSIYPDSKSAKEKHSHTKLTSLPFEIKNESYQQLLGAIFINISIYE